MSFVGRCECGAVSYQIRAERVHVYACHCLNCQTRSGSGFAEHAMVAKADFDCQGATAAYAHDEGGIGFEDVVCATCYTRIFNRNSALPEMVFLRAGTLERSDRLAPMAHIWISRKQPWVTLPEGIACFDESPTPEQFADAVKQADGPQ
ncbi:MAG: GFA family protein [Paracoccus sp. (in: a-proteobacteria)]|nr:GFA family protein [Paracoccus sp. (in: a-proteobacteria)]